MILAPVIRHKRGEHTNVLDLIRRGGFVRARIDGNVVSLRAEVRQLDQQTEGEKVLRSERYFGSVARSFQLPADIDAGQAKAKYDNGILTLTLPKKLSNAAQRLNIE